MKVIVRKWRSCRTVGRATGTWLWTIPALTRSVWLGARARPPECDRPGRFGSALETYAEHYDKIDSFATVYRDSIEIVIVQGKRGTLESNSKRYGAGYDAYINTDTLDGVRHLHDEYERKGVTIVTRPHMTDYGSLEFTFEDMDGRIIGVGLIADEHKYFAKSNYQ